MESLVESMTTQTRISLEDDDVSLIHPRYAQYKQRTSRLNQEERRRQWLLDQKSKRLESFNFKRGIEDDKSNEGNERRQQNSVADHQEKSVYKNWLMLSVWLVDVPENMEKYWYFVICPQGKRTLVIAEKGLTKAYSRHGECLMKFPSELPGGRKDNNGFTVIDCIWDHVSKTYFILDVLIWGIPLTNCEAELRFFWLKNKFIEIPELNVVSKVNRHRFVLLEHNYVSELKEAMLVHPAFENNVPQVDGIIFFHKDSLYTSGKTPLVTWLKPFMVFDILSVKVAEPYYNEIPASYKKKKENRQMEVEAAEEDSSVSMEMATAEETEPEASSMAAQASTVLPVS